MSRPPTRRSGPPPERTYRPKPAPSEPEVRKPRLYDRRGWRGSDGRQGARDLKLRKNPFCERCLLIGKHIDAVDVHHRIDVADAPELGCDLANLESLCKRCHTLETTRRKTAKRHGANQPQS